MIHKLCILNVFVFSCPKWEKMYFLFHGSKNIYLGKIYFREFKSQRMAKNRPGAGDGQVFMLVSVRQTQTQTQRQTLTQAQRQMQ